MATQVGQVVWYVTGRFYGPAQGSPFDAGYFLYVAGISANLFNGAPSESTAYLTFSADPITVTPASNGNLSLSLDATGQFSVYLQTTPAGNFNEPSSFITTTKVATFQRVSLVVGEGQGTGYWGNAPHTLSNNVFSATLVSSTPFQLGGQTYDFAQLLPTGITQWGMGSSQPSNLLPTYPSITPFVGSAVAMGPAVT